jgi:hypothetical protein
MIHPNHPRLISSIVSRSSLHSYNFWGIRGVENKSVGSCLMLWRCLQRKPKGGRRGWDYPFPGDNIKTIFSWSLGHATNNQAETYALFQGLLLARQSGLDSITILCDSKTILNRVRKNSLPADMKLKNIFQRIHQELKFFIPEPFFLFSFTITLWQMTKPI